MKIKNFYCVIAGIFLILSGAGSFFLESLDWGHILYIIGGIMCFIAIKKSVFLVFSSISILIALVIHIGGFFSIGYLAHSIFWILNIIFYEKTR
jgi:hypothetical protein